MKALKATRRLTRFLINGDDESRYRVGRRLMEWAFPKYRVNDYTTLFTFENKIADEFSKLENAGDPMRVDRMYNLYHLGRMVRHIPGETAECGVFVGVASYFMCRSQEGLGKRHFGFDSFEGVSEPGERDGTYWQRSDLTSPKAVAERNLKQFENVQLLQGWIPERFSEVGTYAFSFVHLDVDLYQPTLDSMEFFYPRLSPGGLLVCDDYGFVTCPGAKSAIDEFLSDKPEEFVLLSTGQGFLIKH